MTSPSYTLTHIHTQLNRAADDIIDAGELPDVGVRDALNLIVNATLHYLEHPDAQLSDAVDASYGGCDLAEVLEWISVANVWALFEDDEVIGPRLNQLLLAELRSRRAASA